jgi:hypothetical protein
MSDDWETTEEDGCLFPGECCMPFTHFVSECHTPEMLKDLQEDLESNDSE